MKTVILTIISAIILSLASISEALAQRNTSSDNFETKAAAKANKASEKAVKPVKSTTYNSTSSAVTNIPSSAPTAIYARLVQRLDEINSSLETMKSSSSTLRGRKAKIALKQIDALEAEKRSITTQIDLLPRAAKDPQYALEIEQQEKNIFKQQLRQESDKLISTLDPYAGQLSPDPELQQAYREYIAINITNDQFNTNDLAFRVMFAISKKPLAKSAITLTPVISQKLPNGSTAYYYGNFKSKEEAQNACNKILAVGRYRDAFVVAMIGEKRIPMPR